MTIKIKCLKNYIGMHFGFLPPKIAEEWTNATKQQMMTSFILNVRFLCVERGSDSKHFIVFGYYVLYIINLYMCQISGKAQ